MTPRIPRFSRTLVLGTVLILGLGSSARAGIEAGLAAVEITPQEWPVTLRGSFSPKGTESAHDPLHARSLALRNGDGRAVITIVDILYIQQETLDAIKAEAAKRTGWLPTEMLIAGTHTHSAPSASGSSEAPAPCSAASIINPIMLLPLVSSSFFLTQISLEKRLVLDSPYTRESH